MRRLCIVLFAALLLICGVFAHAQTPIRIEFVEADWDQTAGQRYLLVKFSQAIPAQSAQRDAETVLNGANYRVSEDSLNQDTTTTRATAKIFYDVQPVFTLDDNNQPDRMVIKIPLPGTRFGKGDVAVQGMQGDGFAVEPFTTKWGLRQIKDTSGWLTEGNLNLRGETPVAAFNVGYTHGWSISKIGGGSGLRAVRHGFNLEGTIPLIAPLDTRRAGSPDDASGQVSDYAQFSWMRQEFTAHNLQSYGVVVRSSGRLNGIEVAARGRPYAQFFNGGRGFFGIEGELGFRDSYEWINVTTRAADTGNFLGRVGATIEWAPALGPINRDLGTGLRFFVRARGWVDTAKNGAGRVGTRFRGFLDTELFYNFSNTSRVFLRYERGMLPPDLSRDTDSLFFGIGSSF